MRIVIFDKRHEILEINFDDFARILEWCLLGGNLDVA